MAHKTKECENHCPKCNSESIDWGGIEATGGSEVYYPGTCDDCGCEFKEYYSYSETEWEEEEDGK